MANIIKNDAARPASFGGAVDQLFRHLTLPKKPHAVKTSRTINVQ